MKLYNLLAHMTYAVDAIEGVRDAANARMAKLPQKDSLRPQLQQVAGKCDEFRSKIVATKEGGMVTGEERIREHIGQVYGSVVTYEGRPTDYQEGRAGALAHELEDVITDFQKLTQRDLSAVNSALKKKTLAASSVRRSADWQKAHAGRKGGAGAAQLRAIDDEMRERD